MKNSYVRDIIQIIQEDKHNTIMVFKNRLTNEDINLIGELAVQYSKTIIFATMHDILFNNNNNIKVIK